MNIKKFWLMASMLLTLSFVFTSCGGDDNKGDEPKPVDSAYNYCMQTNIDQTQLDLCNVYATLTLPDGTSKTFEITKAGSFSETMKSATRGIATAHFYTTPKDGYTIDDTKKYTIQRGCVFNVTNSAGGVISASGAQGSGTYTGSILKAHLDKLSVNFEVKIDTTGK